MVLLSRSHVLERHGQDVIPVLTASWPAVRLSQSVCLVFSLLDQSAIPALVIAGVHEVALRGLQKFRVLRMRGWPFHGQGPWLLQRFPQPSQQQVSQPKMVSGDGETDTNLQHQSCLCVCCNERHLEVTPKELETREASRARASPTTTQARARRPPSGT